MRMLNVRILLLRVSSAEAYCYYAYAEYKRSKVKNC
jgi:hypothetical protein